MDGILFNMPFLEHNFYRRPLDREEFVGIMSPELSQALFKHMHSDRLQLDDEVIGGRADLSLTSPSILRHRHTAMTARLLQECQPWLTVFSEERIYFAGIST